jgi:hypothetical protein
MVIQIVDGECRFCDPQRHFIIFAICSPMGNLLFGGIVFLYFSTGAWPLPMYVCRTYAGHCRKYRWW